MRDIAFLVVMLCVLAACGSSQTPSADTRHTERACTPGEQKTEACNSCTCSDGGTWMCTMRLCATCEPDHDQTCNDDPSVSSLWGRCEEGQCVCNPGFTINSETGRCRPSNAPASLEVP